MDKSQEVINLLEGSINDANMLANSIEKEILSIFPDSYVSVKFTTYISTNITIRFLLGRDKSEWSFIPENDPARTLIFIEGMDRSGSINKPLTMRRSLGSIFVKSKNPHLVYDVIKVPFRKVTGDVDAVLKGIKTYFIKLKKILQDNRDSLTDQDLKLIGNKF